MSSLLNRLASAATLAALVVLAPGCLQIETRVKLNPDGSATVTERVLFSRRLLDLSNKQGSKIDAAALLNKDAALERAKHMGKGAELVSHDLHDARDGAKESLSVYRLPDIADFRYASPLLAYTDYRQTAAIITVKTGACYQGGDGWREGDVYVNFRPTTKGYGGRPDTLPPDPAPGELQVYRDLSPLFRDVLKDFKLRLTFESYAPVWAHTNYRGQGGGVKEIDLLNFTDQDLDNLGDNFLGNEEVMLELVQWKLGGRNVCEQTAGYARNPRIPVYCSVGSSFAPYGVDRILRINFRPSRFYFDKYFKGKEITALHKAPRPATFEEIGYEQKPETGEKK